MSSRAPMRRTCRPTSAHDWPKGQRRETRRDRGCVPMVGHEISRTCGPPPLSKEFLAGDMVEADLALEADDDLQADWLLGAAATELDTCSGAIELADGTRIDADGVV